MRNCNVAAHNILLTADHGSWSETGVKSSGQISKIMGNAKLDAIICGSKLNCLSKLISGWRMGRG